MLNELDEEMEKRGLNFVRYADDCIIMVGSEMSANRVMRNITRFIEEKLGLKVNMTKSKVDKPQGQIGRASCRERVEMSEEAVAGKKKERKKNTEKKTQ